MRALLVLLMVGAIGCGKSDGVELGGGQLGAAARAADDRAVELDGTTAKQLAATPEQFRGKTIRTRGKLMLPVMTMSTGANLETIDYGGQVLKIRFDISDSVRDFLVQKVGPFDTVEVTFRCKDGSLTDGNEAVSVKRMN